MMNEEEAEAREAAGMGDSEDDQYSDDDSRKMDTVNEAGNETNQMTTDGKQQKSGGLAGLRDIDDLDGQPGNDDDEEYDDGFEEKEDYEF